jgi:hypothetical protein
VIARRSVWTDKQVVALAKDFVCCADEVWRLQNLGDPDCVYFRQWCDLGGQLNGDGAQTTRQGTYCVSPSGRFLGSCNSRSPEVMAAMLRTALARWKDLDKKSRLLDYDPADRVKDINRAEKHYPADGLVLKVHSRDLNRTGLNPADWRTHALNLDFCWFRKEEMQRLVPRDTFTRDTRWDLPDDLVRRSLRLSVKDNVRGQTPPFSNEQVEKAFIKCKVDKIKKGVVYFDMEGEVKLAAEGRGIEGKIRGKGAWNVATSKFEQFDIVISGTRTGRTQYNAREDDTAAAGIGFVFTMAGDKPIDRIAPAEFGSYGWR